MSHWVTYKNNVLQDTNISILERALSEMNLGLDKTRQQVQNAYGKTWVDYAITNKDGRTLPLGFLVINEDGHTNLELHGDFWETGLYESTFMDNLSQQYQKIRITNTLTQNNWEIENTTVTKDNEIVIEACEYVYA